MIDYATRITGASSNCHFQVGTAEALAFPAEHFDVVMSSLVRHHLPDDLRVAALLEMERVLRPGGKLLVAEAQQPATVSAGNCSREFTATIARRA